MSAHSTDTECEMAIDNDYEGCSSQQSDIDEYIHGEALELQPGTRAGAHTNWGPPQRWRAAHPLNASSRHVNKNEIPSTMQNSITWLVLYFQLLVKQKNLYYQQHLDLQDEELSSAPLFDITVTDIPPFLIITIQMGHDIRDN
jgi:hypothetical protein